VLGRLACSEQQIPFLGQATSSPDDEPSLADVEPSFFPPEGDHRDVLKLQRHDRGDLEVHHD